MVYRIFPFVVFPFVILSTPAPLGQMTDKGGETFYTAKGHLAVGEVKQALPIFRRLWEQDTSNANLHFLLGVCYTEMGDSSAGAVHHLESATADLSYEYDPGNSYERKAPIFTWFYLAVAYSQSGDCRKAEEAQSRFHALYGSGRADYYVLELERRIVHCHEVMEHAGRNTGIDATAGQKKIVTRTVEYSTPAPLYGVQIGAFSRLEPRWFYDLKNVEAYLDKNGMLRYVIGRFPYVSQALALLELVQETGYRDAFIVDVNAARGGMAPPETPRKFTDEIISIDDQSLQERFTGTIEFSVQAGAFRDSVPVELLKLYLEIPNIIERRQNNLTLITVGSYPDYESAAVQKDKLLTMGIPGAFVVAYNNGRKVNVEHARSYLEKKKGTTEVPGNVYDKKK